jgi:hypothetical protein
MQLFSDLRSDYPLNLTLLEHVHACALTWFSPAGLTSARGSPFRSLAPSGGSFRGSLWIVLSTLGITPARMVDIAIRLRPRICTGSRTNFCSSVCAPSARESTCGLTQVRAWVRNFRLHVDAQRTPLVEYRRAHLRGNAELFSRELTARSLSPKSAACAVVEVHMLSTSGPHSPIPTVLCPAFQMQTRRKECTGVCHCLACLFADNGQVRSTKEEHIMSHSRGAVSFEPLFTAEDIGLRKEANVEHVMKVFVTLGEGRASRWIEMPKGVLLLQTVPDDPASGGIYLYDRELRVFYFVVFDLGRDDSLTAAEFDELVTEYNLVSWTAHPALLRRAVGKPGMA